MQTNVLLQKMNSDSSIQAQSAGEDSNSSDTAMSDHGDEPATLKTEPSDYPLLDDHHPFSTNGGIMDPTRNPGGFHNALLGLQGKKNLLVKSFFLQPYTKMTVCTLICS